MDALREFLSAFEPWHVWVVCGVIAEVMLQVVKRYVWQPADEAKAEKLIAAGLVSLVLAVVAGPVGWSSFAATWFGIFLSAVGYHETTDKLEFKAAWSATFGTGKPAAGGA